MEIGANSSLSVVKVNASDAGNYTCSIGSGETLQQYTVLLHILNGTYRNLLSILQISINFVTFVHSISLFEVFVR